MKSLKNIIILLNVFNVCNSLYGYTCPVSSANPTAEPPISAQQSIRATFGEVRKSIANVLRDHFHTGIDIAGSQGSKVYTISRGEVKNPFDVGTKNEGIWIADFAYVHIKIDKEIIKISKKANQDERIIEKGIFIGTIIKDHLHFVEGLPGSRKNPLRLEGRGTDDGGISPFVDSDSPTIKTIQIVPDYNPYGAMPQEFKNEQGVYFVKGKIDIIADCTDKITGGSSKVGIYEIGYEVFKKDDLQNPVIPERTNIRFNHLPSDTKTKIVYAEGSDIQKWPPVNKYIVTNQMSTNAAFDTDEIGPGKYTIFVIARDSDGNEWKKSADVIVVEPPKIFDEKPTGEISERKPEISAKVVSPSEIPIAEAVMLLDGTTVAYYTIEPSSPTLIEISYTPTEYLTIGNHNVEVKTKDMADNEASKIWEFKVRLPAVKIYITSPRRDEIIIGLSWCFGRDQPDSIVHMLWDEWEVSGYVTPVEGTHLYGAKVIKTQAPLSEAVYAGSMVQEVEIPLNEDGTFTFTGIAPGSFYAYNEITKTYDYKSAPHPVVYDPEHPENYNPSYSAFISAGHWYWGFYGLQMTEINAQCTYGSITLDSPTDSWYSYYHWYQWRWLFQRYLDNVQLTVTTSDGKTRVVNIPPQ